LFAKTRAFDALATDPLLLGVLDQVLGHYQLSAPVSICIGPGEKAQILHRDDAIYPVPEPHPPLVVNTMWPLDEFTAENGATRFIPGWLRQQENHCLSVPRDIVRELPERLQELLGYNIYPPFVGYVDGRHPRRVLSAGS
jgi:ectoine hydroxylase-related dioxygenase (phytanoyl-CoA dioxygenase family)